jgi:hypothetical protein
MEPVSLIATLAAGGVASLIMSWLEGRRLRKPRNPDEAADDAAAAAAQEAVDAVSAAQSSIAEGVDEEVPLTADEPPAPGVPGVHPCPAEAPSPPPAKSDEDRLIEVVGNRLVNDAQFRAALGIKKKTVATWVMQGLVSAALLAVSVWAFATNTETGVGFAFCGSLGGFWMREITA